MVTIACPWCDEDAALEFAPADTPQTAFTCSECGTSAIIVDEPSTPLDLAA